MSMQWLRELFDWWGNLQPDMAFLFSLPFVIGAAGFLAHEYRRWRGHD
jgi:hypothetical protein